MFMIHIQESKIFNQKNSNFIQLDLLDKLNQIYTQQRGCLNDLQSKQYHLYLDQIYYWSLHENAIIKIFEGHSQPIISLQVHPLDDRFISTGHDITLKTWKLGQMHQNPIEIIELKNSNNDQNDIYPVSSFDPQGVIFAVSTFDPIQNGSKIRLFDSNELEKGQFQTFHIDCQEIKQLQFSPNGLFIAISTNINHILILDSFSGEITNSFTDHFNNVLNIFRVPPQIQLLLIIQNFQLLEVKMEKYIFGTQRKKIHIENQ